MLELKLCKRVRREAAGQHLEDRDHDRQEHGISNKPCQRYLRPDLLVVTPLRIIRDKLKRRNIKYFRIGLDRSRQHPQERNDHDCRDQNKQRVDQHFSDHSVSMH